MPRDWKSRFTLIVCNVYSEVGSIKKTAQILMISEQKVRKALITAGQFRSEIYDKITAMRKAGASVADISEALNVSPSAVAGYLPYQKAVYGFEPSKNAIRIRTHREKKRI